MLQVVVSNELEITGLDSLQKEKVKEALTFSNPKYESAKKYGRSKYISIPQYLFYYKEKSVRRPDGTRTKALCVPFGFDIFKILPESKNAVWFDNRKGFNGDECSVEYPPFLLTLRDDQMKAVEPFLNHKSINCSRSYWSANGIVQLPTGKGKSILALYLAQMLGVRTLILVHKDDLVVGWQKDIELCFGGKVRAGLIKAKKKDVGHFITIATVQTLSRMSDDELSNYTDQFGLVVQDECHHIGLNMFNLIGKFNSLHKLGLSATPTREDGLNFTFDLFLGGIAYKHVLSKDDKDILPVKVITKTSKAQYRPFIYEGEILNYYDYDVQDLPDQLVLVEDLSYEDKPRIPFLEIDDNVVRNKKHKIMVCKDVIEHYTQGHSCILFFTQKEHIRIYEKYLRRYIPADQILLFYGDSKENTETLMEKAESRKCLVTLATYAKATEGTNVKAWEVAFLVSSINNKKNTEQAVGRIRRSNKGKLKTVILYDYRFKNAYSLSKHGATRDKVYSNLKFDYVPESSSSKYKRGMFSRGYSS